MLITGVRHRINSELNTRSTWTFRRYLLHYLQMFSILGVIFPVLIAIDYFLEPHAIDEAVTKKYYTPLYDNRIDYYIYTEKYNFRCDNIFFDNIDIGAQVTFKYTPIFNVFTNVSRRNADLIYTCELENVYGWSLIIATATFILSSILIIKLWGKRKHIKYELVINMGLINTLLCIITIVAVLFQNIY